MIVKLPEEIRFEKPCICPYEKRKCLVLVEEAMLMEELQKFPSLCKPAREFVVYVKNNLFILEMQENNTIQIPDSYSNYFDGDVAIKIFKSYYYGKNFYGIYASTNDEVESYVKKYLGERGCGYGFFTV